MNEDACYISFSKTAVSLGWAAPKDFTNLCFRDLVVVRTNTLTVPDLLDFLRINIVQS